MPAREGRSHKLKSDAVAARSLLSQKDGTETGEAARSKEASEEGKGQVGGKSIAWMRVLRPPGARKAYLPNVVMLTRDSGPCLPPTGSCIHWSKRFRAPRGTSPQKRISPTLGAIKYVTNQGFWPP